MKVTVKYDHEPNNFDIIEMAISEVGSSSEPLEGWKAAFRDTVNGQRVIWARFENAGTVWVRDRNGSRKVKFSLQ